MSSDESTPKLNLKAAQSDESEYQRPKQPPVQEKSSRSKSTKKRRNDHSKKRDNRVTSNETPRVDTAAKVVPQ